MFDRNADSLTFRVAAPSCAAATDRCSFDSVQTWIAVSFLTPYNNSHIWGLYTLMRKRSQLATMSESTKRAIILLLANSSNANFKTLKFWHPETRQ